MDTFDSYGRNFDDLAPKFKKKVYQGIKGRIRNEVVKRDLRKYVPWMFRKAQAQSKKILDAGCGCAPLSSSFARAGHQVTLCDISLEMLELAKEQFEKEGLLEKIKIEHSPIQKLVSYDASFDIILCHAVIEWVDEPERLIDKLLSMITPGGYLSLTFYNIHGTIFKNLLRANYKKIKKGSFSGWEGSLTPTFPRDPDDMRTLIENKGAVVHAQSGIRVFHDYILNMDDREKTLDTVIDLELKFSTQMPYRDLGRYQHLLCQKP